MATWQEVDQAISEYSRRYRRDGMDAIKHGTLYDLKPGQSRISADLAWPAQWSQSDERGVYAILSGDQVTYIGKASQQALGHRLSSYFKNGPPGECRIPTTHAWVNSPTHVMTWAVPSDSWFEASALEEYLIDRFADQLADNTRGKHSG